jgi:hypothetical protein
VAEPLAFCSVWIQIVYICLTRALHLNHNFADTRVFGRSVNGLRALSRNRAQGFIMPSSDLTRSAQAYWDAAATTYDQDFSGTVIGKTLRAAVWRELFRAFRPG